MFICDDSQLRTLSFIGTSLQGTNFLIISLKICKFMGQILERRAHTFIQVIPVHIWIRVLLTSS